MKHYKRGKCITPLCWFHNDENVLNGPELI